MTRKDEVELLVAVAARPALVVLADRVCAAGGDAKRSDLSSGAMTNRLDQLEKAGLVRRLRDPDDRRGVLVEPTDKGKELWEQAIGVQARKEQLIAAALARPSGSS